MHHPLLPDPQIVVSRLVADSGWSVTLPDRADVTLAVLILPEQADADGWTQGVRREVETSLLAWCATEPWLAEHPPTFAWHTEVNPSETPQDAPGVQALLSANAALGLPLTLGGLGSWYDGATFALEAGTPAVMYGPRAHRPGAHRRRVRPDRRPRRLRAGPGARRPEPVRMSVTAPAQEQHFKRVLGLPALVAFGLAYMVPLTVWTTYGVVTTSTGGHLPAAYLVTTVAMLFTAYSYGRMVVVQPIAGSAYAYASRAFGRKLGFMVGWALLLDYIFLPMINYLVIGLYMEDYFPSIGAARVDRGQPSSSSPG